MKWIVVTLVVALVGSNALWLYAIIDQGVSYTYLSASYSSCDQALAQTVAIVPAVVARRSRAEIIDVARRAVPDLGEPFEKEGQVVVGRVALEFEPSGTLRRVVPER